LVCETCTIHIKSFNFLINVISSLQHYSNQRSIKIPSATNATIHFLPTPYLLHGHHDRQYQYSFLPLEDKSGEQQSLRTVAKLLIQQSENRIYRPYSLHPQRFK